MPSKDPALLAWLSSNAHTVPLAKGDSRYLLKFLRGITGMGEPAAFVEFLTKMGDADPRTEGLLHKRSQAMATPPRDAEKYLKLLKKRAVLFTPSSGGTENERRTLARLRAEAPVEKLKLAELRQEAARIRRFERLLGGKARNVAPGLWKIGPIAMLLLALLGNRMSRKVGVESGEREPEET